MICLIQRVKKCEVLVEKKIISQIKKGMLIFVGIEKNDSNLDIEYIVKKTLNLRIFSDENNNMNLSVKDINGEILVVSQFTLCADIKHGRRPSFIKAEKPKQANVIYEKILKRLKDTNLNIKSGIFGENMNVNISNDGPVTFIINSKEKKNEN